MRLEPKAAIVEILQVNLTTFKKPANAEDNRENPNLPLIRSHTGMVFQAGNGHKKQTWFGSDPHCGIDSPLFTGLS
jgi:hypothetical protein